MADRLERMKSMPFYEKLVGQFPVLDQLVVSKHRIDFEGDLNGLEPFSFIENIQLLKPAAETRVEAESTIKQLADLRKHKIRKTKAYTREQVDGYNKALHQFMEDLFTTGILQSGIEKSYLGFSEYIPASFKRSLFQNALQNFRKTSAENGADYTNFLEQYRVQFTYNNPKYFPYFEVTQGYEHRNPNNYSNRFKNYDIGLSYTAVPEMRDPNEVTEEDAEWSEVPSERKQLPALQKSQN
jgi:hypothetical protein